MSICQVSVTCNRYCINFVIGVRHGILDLRVKVKRLVGFSFMATKLLTITQAAKYKGVSRNAIYQAIEGKRLPSRVSLVRVVVREEDLDAWTPKKGQPKGKPLSKVHKARISEAQKRRWAKRRSDEGS